ncbi:MAG TPA: IS110 family transposase [Acidimicrobiaceae bacterium]|nr:IS110 family transposase [Acidimicrobiaceae bacterium]
MPRLDRSRQVTGGVDTHLELHMAAALDPLGGLLGVEQFPATRAGHSALVRWLSNFGTVARVGVEGTGSYGAGLARHLRASGVEVLEVDRPNRQSRRRTGKSDPADAVEAARAALSGRAQGAGKTRDGNVEAIRALLVAKRSCRSAKIKSMNQIRHLGFTASDDLRERFEGVSKRCLAKEAASMRPRAGSDPVAVATKTALVVLGKRVLALDEEKKQLNGFLKELVEKTAPGLCSLYGVGVDSAASLLVAAGDNPERIKSESSWAHLCGVAPIQASSGKVTRYRLNRGGDRQANAALWVIVLTRMGSDPRTRAYVERRTKEGLSKGEVMRILKRYVAREVFKYLPRA